MIDTLHVIQAPSGVFVLVGRVPAALGYVQAHDGSPITAKQAEAASHCGPGFAVPKIERRTWATREDAIAAVRQAGYDVAG